jgi:peptidylprolyl isomerase
MTLFRRPLLIFLPVIALLVLAACGDDDEEVNDPDSFSTTGAAFATDGSGSPTEIPQIITPPPETPAGENCPAPSGDAPEADVTKQYATEPELTIDPAKTYTAVIHTVRGDITINLRPDLAPRHVNSFVFLAREGYFNGVTFHRVIPGFVAQTGDPTGGGSGGPGYQIPLEATTEVLYQRGTVGMARTSDPNSAGSQFFINYTATPSLDGQYTIFGEVTAGMEVVDCITPRDPSVNPNAPAGDKIISIDITES